GRLARLTFTRPRPGKEDEREAEAKKLAAREQELAASLGRTGRREGGDPWVPVEAVRAALPADAVLVEIARVSLWDFRVRSGKKQVRDWRYLAWVIPPRGRVEVIDLGPAGPIDEAVSALRRSLREAPEAILARGERQAEREAGKPLRALSDLVLRPMWKHLEK